jgi:hypothetical protein
MKTIYMLQHRAEGRITSHVFLNPPTEAQKAALIAELDKRHAPILRALADQISSDEADHWPKVIELVLVEDASEIPSPGDLPGKVNKGPVAAPGTGVAEVDEFTMRGTGQVTPTPAPASGGKRK